jgi:hypothetical protein
MEPKFDSKGKDSTTFAPFVLYDCRQTEWKDLRLEFSAWEWLHEHCGGDEINDYYLNGYGVDGLVRAVRLLHGLNPVADTMEPNSEGDTCFIHFSSYDDAIQIAVLSAQMIKDKNLLHQAIEAAKENGFGDDD